MKVEPGDSFVGSEAVVMATRWRKTAGPHRANGCSRLCLGRHHSSGEEGFTLIELVIVTVILPIVIAGVTAALITVLSDQQSVAVRVSVSAADEITSAYYVRDVQSAAYLATVGSSTSGAPIGDPPGATVAACDGTGTKFIVGMEWNPGGTGRTVVSYWDVNSKISGIATYNIVRYTCSGGAATPTSTVVVATDVSQSDPPTITVTCGSASGPTNCTSSYAGTWLTTTNISGVTILVTQADITSSGQPYDLVGYQYNLVGVPSAWSNGSTSAGSPVPSLLLGGTSATSNCGGNQILCMETNTALGVAGAITFNEPAVNEVDLQTGATVTEAPSTGPFDVYNCATQPVGNICSNLVEGTGWSAPTTATSVGSQVTQLSFPPPSYPSGGTCTGSLSTASSAVTCNAGTYSNGLNFGANNVTLNLQAGNYDFGSTVGGVGTTYSNDIINFAPGEYTFNAGLYAQGSGDTLECLTCTSTAGLFLYVTGGPVDLSATANTFNLLAGPASEQYYGNVLLYQIEAPAGCSSAASDTSPMTIQASSAPTLSESFGGLVVAACAPITITEATKGISFTAGLIGANLTVTGSGVAVSVG